MRKRGREHQARTNKHSADDAPSQKRTMLGEGDLDDHLDGINGPPFVLILDCVQDPQNLGAILRTADGAGVHAVVVPKDKAVGITDTVRRISVGAADSVPFFQVTNLSRTLKHLQDRGLWLTGTSDHATDEFYAMDFTGPIGIVMGAEATGLRRLTEEACDHLVQLPMNGVVDCLNVSVTTGICLYEVVRQRTVQMKGKSA